MEVTSKLKALAEKIDLLKDKIETEESTKHAFVLPFINLLGYDTFDPTEVMPEFTADIGLKKGEKVDYAIFQNGVPILIIECKHWNKTLDVHESQLFRYFHVTKTRFALLTNGIQFRFYTDLEEPNKMDEKPFLEFDLTKIKETAIRELEKFHKTKFDISSIINIASHLKYTSELKSLLDKEFEAPSDEFVKLFASKIYNGRITSSVLEDFREISKKALAQLVSDKVNDRLNAALTKEQEKQKEETIEVEFPVEKSIETTEDELQAFRIVSAILCRKIPINRIAHRDTQSYFGVLLDDNNRKPICRFHFSNTRKQIGIFDGQKNESKHQLESLEDIYNFQDKLLETIEYYE